MPNSINEEIIDLTNLDYNFPRNNPRISINDDVQEVIVLVDDSFTEGNKQIDDIKNRKKKCSKVQNNSKPKSSVDRESANEASSIGDCSICWEKLGKKPLASTKCGHVFCFACLESSLKHSKQCPCCRCILKGASAYHRLYLDLGLT